MKKHITVEQLEELLKYRKLEEIQEMFNINVFIHPVNCRTENRKKIIAREIRIGRMTEMLSKRYYLYMDVNAMPSVAIKDKETLKIIKSRSMIELIDALFEMVKYVLSEREEKWLKL